MGSLFACFLFASLNTICTVKIIDLVKVDLPK
jgi:hypothetical protein